MVDVDVIVLYCNAWQIRERTRTQTYVYTLHTYLHVFTLLHIVCPICMDPKNLTIWREFNWFSHTNFHAIANLSQRSYHTVIATWLCNHLCVRTNPSNEFPLITQSSIVHVTCYTLLIEDRYWITITELPYLKNQSLTYIVTTYRISLWDRGFEDLYK